MEAYLAVDGKRTPLTPKETKAALKAVASYRESIKPRGSTQMEWDMEVRYFKQLGYKDAEIARMLGVTARCVRGALFRVENGRYG